MWATGSTDGAHYLDTPIRRAMGRRGRETAAPRKGYRPGRCRWARRDGASRAGQSVTVRGCDNDDMGLFALK